MKCVRDVRVEATAVVAPVERGVARQAEEADVELPEPRAAAGEGIEIPAESACRVLLLPPAVDRYDVRRDCGGERAEVVVAVRRRGVDDADLVRRRDLDVGNAVPRRFVASTPGNRGLGARGRSEGGCGDQREDERALQCRKCRRLVNTIDAPAFSTASTTSWSRLEPPGWTIESTPASSAMRGPSGNGKNASDASAAPAGS